jgi:hypothetical protein
MFSNFDFNALNDPDFKEDSVREELVLPIVKALGYSVSGDSKLIRSKSLTNPLVAIGSKQRKVSIVPDYLFLSNNKPLWVLEAKSPTENILKSKHVEQAYSYAIHPEVRAEMYALCNGTEFVLYGTRKPEPILHFKLEDINTHWEKLYRILNSEAQGNPQLVDYHPDYGIHMKRIGTVDFRFIGPLVRSNFIAKVEDGKYTTNTVIPGDVKRAMTLDFNEEQLHQLMSCQPKELAKYTINALKRQPYYVYIEPSEYSFGVVADLSNQVHRNAEELYIPFDVVEFIKESDLSNLE